MCILKLRSRCCRSQRKRRAYSCICLGKRGHNAFCSCPFVDPLAHHCFCMFPRTVHIICLNTMMATWLLVCWVLPGCWVQLSPGTTAQSCGSAPYSVPSACTGLHLQSLAWASLPRHVAPTRGVPNWTPSPGRSWCSILFHARTAASAPDLTRVFS